MPIPTDYFDKRIAPEDGLESPSQAQEDIGAVSVAVARLEELANALAERRVRGLDEDWMAAQIQQAKSRYATLKQALIDAGRALP